MAELAIAYAMKRRALKKKAPGGDSNSGEVEPSMSEHAPMKKESMSMMDAIMKKRLMAKHMAEGGMAETDEMDMDRDASDDLMDTDDFLSEPDPMPEDDNKMKRSKMLGSILARVRYGK